MEKSDFKEVKNNDEILPGNRQLIICGFGNKDKLLLKKILLKSEFKTAVLFAENSDAAKLLSELNDTSALKKRASRSTFKSSLPRAVIAAGFTMRDFNNIMLKIKSSSIKKPMWATLTESSKKWTLKYLLEEMLQEQSLLGR